MFRLSHGRPDSRTSRRALRRPNRWVFGGLGPLVEPLEGRTLLSISIDDPTVIEGDSGTVDAIFTVSLSAASAQTVTVQAATANVTASAPSDYTALPPTTLTFAPGETEKTIVVTVNGDTTVEQDELFDVNLSNPTNDTIADGRGRATIRNDDGAVFITNTIRDEGDSGTTPFSFLVVLGAPSTKTITVQYATADGTAQAGSDYTATSGTLTFAPGETQKTFDVLVSGDTTPEPGETFFVNLSNATNATITDSQGFGAITDDDSALVISGADVVEGDSGTVDAVFTVSLTKPSAQTVTVDFATSGTTATAGVDYTDTAGTLTFAPGETQKTIAVAVHGDTTPEPDDVFAVKLTNPVNATLNVGLALGVIGNDDATISVADASVTEGDSGTVTMQFPVTLPFRSTRTVTVDFATADGSAAAGTDYIAASGTLIFNPGEVAKTIDVTVNGDTDFETDETLFVNLSSPFNATLSDPQGLGRIVNDDSTLSIDDVTVTEGDSGTVDAVFTVRLSAPSTQAVSVQVATADDTASAPTDYVALPPTTLTFAPGETEKTIAVRVNGDSDSERIETFFVNLSNPTNATVGDGQGIGRILNDDGAVFITNVIHDEGDSGTTPYQFLVLLRDASTKTITVRYATTDGDAQAGSDYTAASGTLTFAPGETQKVVDVLVSGDTTPEPNEAFFINLSDPTNAAITDGQGFGSITNDDSALVISGADLVEGDSGTVDAVFTVSLTAPSTQTVTVDFATGDTTTTAGVDYTATAGTLTFAPGQTSQTITVSVNGDTTPEPDDVFAVILSNPINATLNVSLGLGVIHNDDATISVADASVTEGDIGTVDLQFLVSLPFRSTRTVTVDFATADGSAAAGTDYIAASGALTFNPGEVAKTITVKVNGDTNLENDETLFVNLSNPVNATLGDPQGRGQIINDDSTLSIDDVTVIEGDSGTVDAVFTVRLSAPSTQAVTVQVATADDTASAPTDYVALPPTTLTFAPGETTQKVIVAVQGDITSEESETFFVNLSNPTNTTITDGQGLGTIRNDDGAVFITNVIHDEGDSGTTPFRFLVLLRDASTKPITVQYATADGTAQAGSDYTAASGTLTFAPGETQKYVDVLVHGDTTPEPNEAFFINLSDPTNAAISDGQGSGSISNDDASLSIDDVEVTEGDTGTVTAVFTVTMSAPSTQAVTVDFATADGSATAGSDYASARGTLTFGAGDITRTIAITVNGDTTAEPDEIFSIQLSNPTNAVLDDAVGLGTIRNDDPGGTLEFSDAAYAVNESGDRATITVIRTGGTLGVVTVNFATADGTAQAGSDYTANSGILTFGTGETSQSFTVRILDDALSEGDEIINLTLSGPTGGATLGTRASATLAIVDDDTATPLQVTGFDVQKGAIGRSFIRFVDLTFDQSSGLDALIDSVNDADPANDRIRLVRLEPDGTGGTDTPIANRLRAVDRVIEFDFGAGGITGDPDSRTGDGYYELRLDLDNNGSLETTRRFYRLLGDVNADQQVDIADINFVTSMLGTIGSNVPGDVDGDGLVSAFDRTLVRQSRGRRLTGGLSLDD